MLRIHDLLTGFEGLTVPGLQYYADRALVLRGTAAVPDGPIDDHLDYLADVGIGAEKVLRVASTDLVREASSNGLLDVIRDHVKDGIRVQFFSSTCHEERLLAALGFGWDAAFGAPVAVADQANDKAELRRLGATLGLSDAFPRHRICGLSDPGAVYAAVGDLVADDRSEFVVVKRPDLASGDGMVVVPKCREWLDHVEPYLRDHAGAKEVIVEAGYAHEPYSIQWEVGDDGPAYAMSSGQLIDESFVHLGNVVSSDDLDPSTVAEMRRLSEPFVRHYWRLGYRGICGFDFMRAKRDQRMYLLECNGRVTAATYAIGVGRQLAERTPSWAVLMTNVHVPSSVRTFDELRRRLGRRLYNGRKGALPFNVRCLGLDKPKFTVCCVGRDVTEAGIILGQAKRKLAG